MNPFDELVIEMTGRIVFDLASRGVSLDADQIAFLIAKELLPHIRGFVLQQIEVLNAIESAVPE